MLRFFLLGGIFALFLDLYASATSTQVVTFSVSAIEAISVSGNPAPLNITAALPGSPPHSATDSLTSYSLTSNLFGETITGSIDVAMPANTSLSIRLAAPIGAASSGPVDLTTTPKNLVTSIGPVAQRNLPISYTLSAGASATPFSSTTRTVTLTLGP